LRQQDQLALQFVDRAMRNARKQHVYALDQCLLLTKYLTRRRLPTALLSFRKIMSKLTLVINGPTRSEVSTTKMTSGAPRNYDKFGA
jgi:hypothetical protein